MALEIFKLVGSIFIDTDKANESMKKTDSNATKMAEGLGKAGKVAAGVGVAIGTAVVGAGTALVEMANDASKTADEIDKMSQKIGMSAEGYQEWSYIMEQNGMDVDKLQTGMKTLVTQMDKVKDGNADAINTFKELGVEVLNADGSMRSQEEVMNDTIRALAEMGNTAERAKLQTELFGKAGTEMAPMLNQGAAAIDDLKQRAHDLGLVMSDEAVKTGVEYGDLSNDLQKSFGMLKTNLGSALFPVLNQVIHKLIEFMPTIQQMGEKLGPVASTFIEKLIPPLADLAEQLLPVLLDSIGEILPMLGDIANSIVPVLVDIITELTPILVQIIQQILPVVADLLKLILPIVSALLQAITPILGAVLKLLSPLLELISAILTPILELLNVLLEPLLKILDIILVPMINILGYMLEPLTQLLSMILEPMLEILGEIISPLLKILGDCLEPIFQLIQDAYEWAAPVFTNVLKWLGDFFEFVISSIKENVGPVLQGAWDFLKGFASFFMQTFVDTFKRGVQTIGDFFTKIWDGIKETFREGINFWISAINTFIDGINKIEAPDWLQKITGITSTNIPTIPMLAEGGNITRAGNVIVGEKGPELLTLPRGAQVTPLSQASRITKEDMTAAFVEALQTVGIQLTINPNESKFFESVIKQNITYKQTHGGMSAI